MSGRRMLKLRLAPSSARRIHLSTHRSISNACGLLRGPAGVRSAQRRPWPQGAYSLHNATAVRTISFARVLPNLAVKLLRIPAMFGGAAIAGLAYLQYQATRMLFWLEMMAYVY